jgi:hypothetical protein
MSIDHTTERTNPTTSDYLTEKEAANVVRLAPITLSKYRLTGGGPEFIKLGRRVVYSRRSLDAWMNARVRTSTSDIGAEPARTTPSYAPAAAAPPVSRPAVSHYVPDYTPKRPRQM